MSREEGRMHGGRGRRLEIVSAKYGAGDILADVTGRLRSLVSDDRLVLVVNRDSMGRDPVKGVEKTLTVEYYLGGVRGVKVTAEYDRLALP